MRAVRFDGYGPVAVLAVREVDDPVAGAGEIVVAVPLAELVAAGKLEVPIAARFPLEQVQAAYTALANDHPLGKIVLVP